MPTKVLVQGREATLTDSGWKSGDPAVDRLCDAAVASGAGGFHWHPNPAQTAADTLAAATGGQVLEVEPFKDLSPPDSLN